MKIAIDGMGGDEAPGVVVEGVLDAASRDPATSYILVGPRDRLEKEFQKRGGVPPSITLEHASQVIDMHEHPVESLKRKRDNSIMRAVKLVKEGRADGIMSAGNTGAVVAASIFKLGLIEGVKRAGIMVPFPSACGRSALIDVGANINSRPINYLQYAIMASAYLRIAERLTEEPRVGLLNIGEESEKGTPIVQHAYQGLKKFFGDRFVGNVEGHEILAGKAHVVACDGFVGNVVLKLVEGVMEFMRSRVDANGLSDETKSRLQEFRRSLDFSEYGGAPLLGVSGVVIIAHGRSDRKAIDAAVRTTVDLCAQRLVERIAQDIKSLSLWKRVTMWFDWKDE